MEFFASHQRCRLTQKRASRFTYTEFSNASLCNAQQHRTLNCSVREPVHPASSLSLQDFLLSSFARRSLMGNIYFEGLNHLGAGVQPFSCRINSTKDQYSNSNVGLFNCILGTMNVHQLQDQSIRLVHFHPGKLYRKNGE